MLVVLSGSHIISGSPGVPYSISIFATSNALHLSYVSSQCVRGMSVYRCQIYPESYVHTDSYAYLASYPGPFEEEKKGPCICYTRMR